MAALWIWLAIAVICVIAEVLTVNLIFFMIAAGAAAGAVADVAGLNGPLQILIAAVVAAAGLLLVRPVLMRRFMPANPASATNVDALIGKLALTAETVTDTAGTATINGETWSARVPVAAESIPAAQRARIVRIDGVYLILSANPNEGGAS
jgi:membrane protein implicated in regulation of membrane protease activity